MGTTGTGNFSDYSGSKPDNTGKKEGSTNEDRCNKAFSTSLEDVSRCQYYTRTKNLPPDGTEVDITFNKRLIVITMDGEEIGYLPTRFNYIRYCIEAGFSYGGEVSFASLDPIPGVSVDITPK